TTGGPGSLTAAYGWSPMPSSSVEESCAQEIVEFVDGGDFFGGGFGIVGQADELDGGFVDHDIPGARIAVARLADRTDGDDRLFLGQFEFVIQFIGSVKIRHLQ